MSYISQLSYVDLSKKLESSGQKALKEEGHYPLSSLKLIHLIVKLSMLSVSFISLFVFTETPLALVVLITFP